jgi:2'-5' RNA ligase superfamily
MAAAILRAHSAPSMHGAPAGLDSAAWGEDRQVTSESGESAIVVPVPEAEPVVARWRGRLDDSTARGMPAHVTVLAPFLGEPHLTGAVVDRLGELCAAMPATDVQFERTERFPDVLYLDPNPASPFRDLTAAIVDCWPETPPYGGMFDEVIPHLTVVHGVGEDALREAETDVSSRLPVRARIAEARLYVFDGARWSPRARFPFRGDP